jgi:hypothetical protein
MAATDWDGASASLRRTHGRSSPAREAACAGRIHAAPCRVPNPMSIRIEPLSQAVFVNRLTLRELQK